MSPARLAPVLGLLAATAQTDGSAGWTGYAPVAELRPTVHGRFLVHLEGADNPTDCRSRDWFYRDHSGLGADQIFRLLLAAAVHGKAVRVYATGVCDLEGRSAISAAALSP